MNLSGEDLAQIQAEANNTVVAICDALQAAGLAAENISTNYIYISPRYDYSGEIERMVGYSINNSLTITTENIDAIGAYIDAAFAAGANTFDSIEFTVEDDSAARKQALELAVQDAMNKAEIIAAAAGTRAGRDRGDRRERHCGSLLQQHVRAECALRRRRKAPRTRERRCVRRR